MTVASLASPGQDPSSRSDTPDSGWFPLSAIQRSLWFLYEMEPEQRGYFNIAFAARARPAIDAGTLQWALDVIVARHPMLRATLALRDGVPMQRVDDGALVALEVFEVDDLDDPAVVARVEADRVRPFELGAPPLLRACLYRAPQDECVIVLVFDHMVCDGWSLWQLLDELDQLLRAEAAGDEAPEFVEPPHFSRFVTEQREWLSGNAGARQLEYWRGELADSGPLFDLQADHRPDGSDERHGRETVNLFVSEELTGRIGELSEKHGVNMFSTLLASYCILLSRLSGERRIAVGSPMPGRNKAWGGTIGNFTNPVVLAADVDPQISVAELLKQVGSTAWRGLKNQNYPISDLVTALNPARSDVGQPYFKVLFTFQKARAASDMMGLMAHREETGAVPWGGIHLHAYGHIQNNGGVGMDLVFELAEFRGRLCAPLDFDKGKFERATVERFLLYWQELLRSMVDDDTRPVSQLVMLPAAEREQVVSGWNATAKPYPLARCVHELFESQAARTPQAPAVRFGGESLGYGELNARANRLAHHLARLGVGPEVRVALCVERGFHMVTGLLAVLKAGGAYVPLDPAYPGDRLAYMLADSE
ncbi:condensation domain-containing protein, partial [Thauera sinica]